MQKSLTFISVFLCLSGIIFGFWLHSDKSAYNKRNGPNLLTYSFIKKLRKLSPSQKLQMRKLGIAESNAVEGVHIRNTPIPANKHALEWPPAVTLMFVNWKNGNYAAFIERPKTKDDIQDNDPMIHEILGQYTQEEANRLINEKIYVDPSARIAKKKKILDLLEKFTNQNAGHN